MHGKICRFLIAFGALLLAVLASRVAHAQAPVDIFELEYEYDPPSPIQDPEGANQEHLEIQTSTLNTSLVYPI
ncbi:hypothetical protein KDL45_07190, partial [bacterium]|nr:hypothetical protein [bacterium]